MRPWGTLPPRIGPAPARARSKHPWRSARLGVALLSGGFCSTICRVSSSQRRALVVNRSENAVGCSGVVESVDARMPDHAPLHVVGAADVKQLAAVGVVHGVHEKGAALVLVSQFVHLVFAHRLATAARACSVVRALAAPVPALPPLVPD